MKRAHYFQHVPFEGLGSIEPWLREAGYSISRTRLFADDPLPSLGELDLLIIMGGPMSVNDGLQHPWLVGEMSIIRRAIEAELPVLGVCLGAQLIASCMGGRVLPNPAMEIGWFPVRAIDHNKQTLFAFPAEFTAFHWHGETFRLPPGAVHVATSEACHHQAFQLGPKVMGLQFHLETTPETAAALIENCRDDLVEGPYVQNEEQIMALAAEHHQTANAIMARILTHLTGSTDPPPSHPPDPPPSP